MLRKLPPTLVLFIAALAAPLSQAHPIPDIPVHSSFDGNAGITIRIEIDPRCFELDPNKAPSMLTKDLAALPAPKKAELKTKAAVYAARAVRFIFEPGEAIQPTFNFQFTGQANVGLSKPDDVVVLTGTWSSAIPTGAATYHIAATPEGTLSVLNFNEVRGQRLERFQVLFPGETGYKLDLHTLQPLGKPAADMTVLDAEPTEEVSDSANSFAVSPLIIAIGAIALVGIAILLRGRKP